VNHTVFNSSSLLYYTIIYTDICIMDSSVAAISHQVFGLAQRVSEGRVKSQAEGVVEKLRVYTWPKGMNPDHKLSFLAFFTAHGRSEGVSPSAWATWAFSFIVLCFPEMAESVMAKNGREYTFVPLPQDYVNQVLAVVHAAEDYSDSQPAEYGRYTHDIKLPSGLPPLGDRDETMPPELAACATIPAIYGYCSLIMFLAGKRISDKNAVAITEKRPANLINAYNIDENASYILNGEGRMQSTAHHNINQAWNTYYHVRAAVVSEIAAFASGSTLAQRVVYTITKMLEYSGMQPAYFIHRFLQARPEVIDYSCIRPAFNAYVMSIREVAGAPGYIQPYYKLIHGDSTRAFHRHALLVLSACAITYEKYTSPSMNNFNLGEGATAAVNLFDAEAASKGHATLQNLTFAVREEEDVE
jgi:hypothetical protein